MGNEIAIVEQEARPVATTALTPTNMAQALELAKIISAGKMVPQHLQGSPADCLMVIEQAVRWRMSPFAVAQCTSSVRGKLMYEGKLVAAAVHTSGVLDGRLDYEFKGSGQGRTVTVLGKIRGESKIRTIDLVFVDAVTENGCWKKQPDQQLVYAGVRVWARRHTPEVMLGVYTPDEHFEDVIDAPVTVVQTNDLMPRARSAAPAEPVQEPAPAPTNTTEPEPAPAATAGSPPVQQQAPAPAAAGDALPASHLKMIRSALTAFKKIEEPALAQRFGVATLELIPKARFNDALGMAKGG